MMGSLFVIAASFAFIIGLYVFIFFITKEKKVKKANVHYLKRVK